MSGLPVSASAGLEGDRPPAFARFGGIVNSPTVTWPFAGFTSTTTPTSQMLDAGTPSASGAPFEPPGTTGHAPGVSRCTSPGFSLITTPIRELVARLGTPTTSLTPASARGPRREARHKRTMAVRQPTN